MARHEYDPKTGLLQPYYRGMRYGAIRSYDRTEKTLSSKEWWLKDRKMTELKDQPLQFANRRPAVPTTPVAVRPVAMPSTPIAPVAPTPVAVVTDASGAPPDMPIFSTGDNVPDLPGGLPADAIGIDSPFLPPVGGGTPAVSTTIPGMPLPGNPLPGVGGGAFPADPGVGGGAFPAVPGAGGGAFPADPGGGAPPAPPVPVDNNPFGAPPPPGANPVPAVPAPAPVDQNPFPAPPAPGGGPAPAVPAVPAPVDQNPFPAPPAPGGEEPGKPPPLPF